MKNKFILFLLLLLMVACQKVELYHDLSEEDANDMLVVLQIEGVPASKIKEIRQNEVFWTISVDSKKISQARKILVDHNLPRKKEQGLAGVYKEKGLIPTPDEQKARYLLALKGEIINSLIKIPEVVDVDVVLNIPSPEEFGSTEKKEIRPTASVIIKARPSAVGENLSEAKIQQFVANAVERLNPRDVSVIISYLSSPNQVLMPGQSVVLPSSPYQPQAQESPDKPVTRIAGLEVVSSSQSRLRVYLIAFFAILAGLGVVLVIMVIRSSRMKQELKEYRGEGSSNAQMVEGKLVEDRPKLKSGQ